MFPPVAVEAGAVTRKKDEEMSVVNEVNGISHSLNGRTAGILGGLAQRYAQYRAYRRTVEELKSLSDRELADLGVSRHGINAIAFKAAYDG